MLAPKGRDVPIKAEAKLAMMANGVVATLRGRISLDQIHDWIDRVAALGHTNWAIIDLRDMRGSESGVWATLEIGLKKVVKKGAKRLVLVVSAPDQVRLIQSATKRAGVNNIAEYFDASSRSYDQTKIVTYLRENWNKRS